MKIMIVDEQRILRDGLQAALEAAGSSVVGSVASGHEALELAHRLRPDVVIIDATMPELNGIETTRRLASELPQVRVLGLSMKCDRASIMAMFEAGAAGYLHKTSASVDELMRALGAVASGQKYVSPAITAIVLGSLPDGAGRPAQSSKLLSFRERAVLQLLADGKSSKEIACFLNVGLPTVETHRRQVMNKLGLRTVAQLTKYAVREGISSLE